MKDHEKRELINKLRDIAVQFAHTQQLRQRIAEVVLDALAEHEKEQEPVAWISKHGVVYPSDAKYEVNPVNELQPLYTAPPQREWVGLTDEEVASVLGFGEYTVGSAKVILLAIAHTVEAKLKEKNSV